MPEARAGENVGVLLRGVKLKSVRRGMIICQSNHLNLTNHVEAQVYLLHTDDGGRRTPLQVFIFTDDIVNINFLSFRLTCILSL